VQSLKKVPDTSVLSTELKGAPGPLPDTNEERVMIAARAINDMIFFINLGIFG
jgi:hypothetical protein